jgi:muramoyltetrapeptide carboxypeptidase
MSNPELIFPEPLHEGDRVRVVAPSFSMAIIDEATRQFARTHFENELGLELTYGEHVEEIDRFKSSSIEARVDDIHQAFIDPTVKAIFSVIGGYNSNQLLRSLDWGLIRNNPKILCGYSDITALGAAMVAKSGLVTYSGPHFSSLGQKHLDPFITRYLKAALFSKDPYEVTASKHWTDEAWYLDQNNRTYIPNEGHWPIQAGKVEQTTVGGNLGTLLLLRGTEFMPVVTAPILFVEDTGSTTIESFDRDLQSLLHAQAIGGLIIGRFQKESNVTRIDITEMVAAKPELNNIPIVANVDIGHTFPLAVLPIGGTIRLDVAGIETTIEVIRH